MEITFNCLPLCQTSEIFSCLFVKFVLYTAGFLGEGTLLILSPVRFILRSVLSFSHFYLPVASRQPSRALEDFSPFCISLRKIPGPSSASDTAHGSFWLFISQLLCPPPCTLMWFQFPSETLGSGPPSEAHACAPESKQTPPVHTDVVAVPFQGTWFRPPSEALACAPGSRQTPAVHSDVLPVPF